MKIMKYFIALIIVAAVVTFVARFWTIIVGCAVLALAALTIFLYFNKKRTIPSEDVSDNKNTVPSEDVAVNKNTIPSYKVVDVTENNNRNKYYYAVFPAVTDGVPLVYYYRNVKINGLDSPLFDSMVRNDDYSIDISPDQAGGAMIKKDGKLLGTIAKYGDMISDWQKRCDPMVCKITEIKEGREAVGLAFYRDVEKKLAFCKHEAARLVKNRSEEMQISLSCLYDGEMLEIFPEYIDEYDAIPVQRKTGEELGFLPKKFNKIYEESEIRGVFVDHVDEDVNDNGDYVYSAYVRVYW